MFEDKMEEMVPKVLNSLIPRHLYEFHSIKNLYAQPVSFESAYSQVKTFFHTESFKCISEVLQPYFDLDNLLEEMRPIAAAYCCYFGMDYVYRMENPDGEEFNFEYIHNLYGTNVDENRQIYQRLYKKIKQIHSLKRFEDTKYVNPGGFRIKYQRERAEWEEAKKNAERNGTEKDIKEKPLIYDECHVYLPAIIDYLNKCLEKKNGKTIIYDLLPSMTLSAIGASGSLPNGGITNKSMYRISGNILNTIDQQILGESFFTTDNKEIPLSNLRSIRYQTSSPEVAEIINLVAIDDIYRQDRLNRAIIKHVACCMECKEEGHIDAVYEEVIANLCSFFLSIPVPMLKIFEPVLDDLINFIKSDSRENAIGAKKCTSIFLSFSGIIFPYFIGLLCQVMFYEKIGDSQVKDMKYIIGARENAKHAMTPIVDMKRTIGDLEQYIYNNREKFMQDFKLDKDRIWSKNGNIYAKKYVRHYTLEKGRKERPKGCNVTDWAETVPFKFPFYRVTETMLVPQIRTVTLVDENYAKYSDMMSDVKHRLKLIVCPYSNHFITPSTYLNIISVNYLDALSSMYSGNILNG